MELPKIHWDNLPEKSKQKELVLSGHVKTNDKIRLFEITTPDELIHFHDENGKLKFKGRKQPLNEKNEFVYKIILEPGKNMFQYKIETESGIKIFEDIYIEFIGNSEEIFDLLVKNKLFKFPKEELSEPEVKQILSSLSYGYFLPDRNNSLTYFYVQTDSKTSVHYEDSFKNDFEPIANGLRRRGCNVEIGKEYFSMEQLKNKNNVFEYFIEHSIEINGEKELIFKGKVDFLNYDFAYFDKLVEITNRALNAGGRSEKVHLVGVGDGTMICLLSEKDFLLLEEICKPLSNQFFKE